MIIQGRFIGDAPYSPVHVQSRQFEGLVWTLADTGASHTTLLDRDLRSLGVPATSIEPASTPMVGIGGSVRSFLLPKTTLTLASDQGDVVMQQDLWVAQHDLERLPPDEVSRLLRLPSLLGRDVINQFSFSCDYHAGTVQLSRDGERKDVG